MELSNRGEGAKGEDEGGFRLNIANAIWGQKDYQFLSTFLDLLAENYGAGLRVLDFAKEPEESRIAINEWVSDETNKQIKDPLLPGSVDSLTRLILTNPFTSMRHGNIPSKKMQLRTRLSICSMEERSMCP